VKRKGEGNIKPSKGSKTLGRRSKTGLKGKGKMAGKKKTKGKRGHRSSGKKKKSKQKDCGSKKKKMRHTIGTGAAGFWEQCTKSATKNTTKNTENWRDSKSDIPGPDLGWG